MSRINVASSGRAANGGVRRPSTIPQQCIEIHRILDTVYHHMYAMMDQVRQLHDADNPGLIWQEIEFRSDYIEHLYRGLLRLVSNLLSQRRTRAHTKLVQRAYLHLHCAIDVYLSVQQKIPQDIAVCEVSQSSGRNQRIKGILADLDRAFELLHDVLTCTAIDNAPCRKSMRPRSMADADYGSLVNSLTVTKRV